MKILNKNKVFLGGTCPSSKDDFDYRALLIPCLNKYGIDYFNPVVKDWTPECRENEEKEKLICNIHLYVISPNVKGMYSIAEAFSTFIKYPNAVAGLCFINKINNKSFDEKQVKSNNNIQKLFLECSKIDKAIYNFSFNMDENEIEKICTYIK